MAARGLRLPAVARLLALAALVACVGAASTPYPDDPLPGAPCIDVNFFDIAFPVRSLNPPPPPRGLLVALANAAADPSYVAAHGCIRQHDKADAGPDQAWKLVIGVAAGIKSAPDVPLEQQPLIKTLLPSLAGSLVPKYAYRFYLAFDLGDPLYDKPATREKVAGLFAAAVAAMPADKRPLVSVHWVMCPACAGKPAHAHSMAATTAVVEGAEYVFRVNDDTLLPQTDWATAFIADLAGRSPIPNLGVVGPDFDFNVETPVLSHDFTHKTHARVFGFHYPPTLPDWSSDDWITYVYDQFNATRKLPHVRVKHVTELIRYSPSATETRQRAMTAAIEEGKQRIDAFTKALIGLTLPHTPKRYTTP